MARQALTRLERALIALVAYYGACTGQLRGQDSAIAVWYLPMLAELGQIADTATIEHVRCLLGAVRGDTMYVIAAWEPPIIHATALIASFGPCPPLLTLGGWHNHIPRDVTVMGEDRGARPPAEYCELSQVDRRAALRPDAPLFQVIHVNRDITCAWVLYEGLYERMTAWPPQPSP